MNQEWSKRPLAIGAALLLVLIAITMVRQRSRQHLALRIRPPDAPIIARWQQAAFTEVAEVLRHPELLNDLATTNATPISSAQSRVLRNGILACLRAFSEGSYDAFHAFVAPLPLRLTPDGVASMRRFLRDPLSVPRIGRAPEVKNPKSVARILAHGAPEAIYRAYFRVMSDDTAYKDYWQGIAISNSWLTTFSADSLPSDLMNLMFERMENVGVIQAVPNHDYRSMAERCLAAHSTLLCADVCLLVRRQPPDPVAPFVIRFFWAPENGIWIPYGLGMASTYAATAIQPMF